MKTQDGKDERIQVAKSDKSIATARDRQVFFDAVFGQTKPNQTLIAAAERFKAKSPVR